MIPIRRVAIVGGTHGNEFTGAYLVKKFERFPYLVERPGFETLTLLGNPQAFAVAKRYLDEDLNRCFLEQDLQNPTLSSYEALRAKTLNQILGPKGNSQVDFLLDLHSTTANMGLTLILVNQNPFNLKLAAYLSSIDPFVRIYRWTPGRENSFVNSLCELGFAIEVGPIAQGVLKASIFSKIEALVYAVLDYIDKLNQGNAPPTTNSLILYEHLKVVDYPKDRQGEIQAMIHPQLQDRDYAPLNPGNRMFLTFEGKSIPYEGESTVWPIFINEAAYYEKGIAMCLTQRRRVQLK